MWSPAQFQGDPGNSQEPAQDGAATGKQAAEEVAKAFQAVLEQENQALRKQFGKGFNPMQAQARALLWLMALHDIHTSAVKQAIADSNGEAVSGWAEDMGKLSSAITVLETIQPIP